MSATLGAASLGGFSLAGGGDQITGASSMTVGAVSPAVLTVLTSASPATLTVAVEASQSGSMTSMTISVQPV